MDFDFEHAYETLEGHDHFFTESLRGTVRQHQLRLDEATAHLNRAEELFRHHDINSENLRLYFLHRSECMALASVREAITRAEQPGPDEPATQAAVANADEAFRRLEGLDYAENDIRLWNLQNLHRTLHKAIRDDLNGAVEVLNDLIDEARYQFQEHHVLVYTLASAVFRQLGEVSDSQRFFENAMNGVGMLRQSYSVVLSHYRFFGLLEMWNDPQHASEWLTRARKLDAPEKTHAVLEKRVRISIDLYRQHDRLFIF